jgi:voltage-gated potassium channel
MIIGWAEIVIAVVMCIWIPIRMLFHVHLPAGDTLVDLLSLIYLRGLISAYKSNSSIKLLWRVPLFLPLTMLGHVLDLTWFNYVLVFKLLAFFYIFKINRQLEHYPKLHPILLRLLPIAVTMPVIIHFISCGWIALGGQTLIENPDDLTRYVSALYWCITTLTTVGYGDIAAKTIPQMLYSNMSQIIGVAFFGYVLSNIASLLSRMDAAREQHLGRLDRIESFFSHYKVPNNLRYKIRSYYQYVWESNRGYDDKAILDEIPMHLRRDIALFISSEMIEKVPLLKGADHDLIRDLVLKLESMICVPQEQVFHVGEIGDVMYFIHRGEVEVLSKEGERLATLGPGSFFGELALLTSKPRSATIRAVGYCDLFALKQDDFESALKRYPDFAAHVHEIARQRAA